MSLAAEWTDRGSTLFVTVDSTVAAVLLLDDALKPVAAETVSALAALGVRSVMLTGDKLSSAQRVARAGARSHDPHVVARDHLPAGRKATQCRARTRVVAQPILVAPPARPNRPAHKRTLHARRSGDPRCGHLRKPAA
eukprot:7110348-Prymnesium_polylepis.3